MNDPFPSTDMGFKHDYNILAKKFPLCVVITMRDKVPMPRVTIGVVGMEGKATATLWGTRIFLVTTDEGDVHYCSEDTFSWDVER